MNEDQQINQEVDLCTGPNEFLTGSVQITFYYENCECSSDCGNQVVTEKWQEINIVSADLQSYVFLDQNDNEIQKEISPVQKDELIETAIREFTEE